MKKVEQLLSNWRLERNIKTFPLTIKEDLVSELNEVLLAKSVSDWNNYVEELADIAIFAFNGIGLMNLQYKPMPFGVKSDLKQLESYINNIRVEIPYQTYIILCTIISMCDELVLRKGYDFKKVLNEKIKVISSCLQCPIQKAHWKLHGASGKWEKSKRAEDKELVYVGNYGKCRIQ